jgi:hypothetical protein
LEVTLDTINILSLVIGILGLSYAIYSTRQLTKGMKIGALQHIRTLINRMEEEKGKQPPDSTQYQAMHHTQQELDTLFKTLQKMFNVPDSEAPLT